MGIYNFYCLNCSFPFSTQRRGEVNKVEILKMSEYMQT